MTSSSMHLRQRRPIFFLAKISFQDVKDVVIFSYLTVEMTGQQYFKLCDVLTFYPTQKKSVWMYIKNQEVNSLSGAIVCVQKLSGHSVTTDGCSHWFLEFHLMYFGAKTDYIWMTHLISKLHPETVH